ncbi:hypothetical protein D3C83_118600 [compost metagenome]
MADRLAGLDFLDPVDDAETKRAPCAVESAEQQYRYLIRGGGKRRLDGTAAAFQRFEPHPADLGKPGRIEQQDRAPVVGQGGAGI